MDAEWWLLDRLYCKVLHGSVENFFCRLIDINWERMYMKIQLRLRTRIKCAPKVAGSLSLGFFECKNPEVDFTVKILWYTTEDPIIPLIVGRHVNDFIQQ
jgi:hypothetical protein